MFQLRTYTLANQEAAQTYLSIHWKRHLESLPKFGVKVHGVFAVKDKAQVVALVSYQEGVNISQIDDAYMKSPEFRSDMEGFDIKNMKGVDTILLEAACFSCVK